MKNMGVQEAAAAIRERFASDHSFQGSPDEAHRIKFAKDVAHELGAGDGPETIAHIMVLLREAGIALASGQEYPKYVTRKWDNTSHIAQDEHHAERIINEPAPEPAPPAPRVVDAPVQAPHLDLRDKVPHMVSDAPPPHQPDRVPNDVTNAAAAQTPVHVVNAAGDTGDADGAQIEEVDVAALVPDDAKIENPGRKSGNRKRPE